ncbi:MAG: hypothetical protein GQ534_04600 [Candidatus Delongbacteria bacterium]|nr:hypothetical protein [Candidatus Delongbacteria bacterium]
MGLKDIYKKLNMTSENGLNIIEENKWKGKLPKRLEFLIEEKLKPNAFFCFDNKPLVLFYDSPKDRKKLFKDIWNFNESAIVIINESESIEIYNGFSYLKNEETLEKLADKNKIEDFSYFNIVTGKSISEYEKVFSNKNRVDYYLLDNIREAHDILIDTYNLDSSIANALIGKCIFIRYLIDREVKLNFENQSRIWTNDEFCDLLSDKVKLLRFFSYFRTQFNGEAFLRNDDKLKDIPIEAFSVLNDLLKGTELSSGQQSLFDIYDFSIIPVEFISNVYEHFIGKENQAEKGAYYTPKFLVDYILSETVEKYFDDNSGEYNCKILDPSCGSGIFLVEGLRRIIEQYLELNNNKITKSTLKKIAEENIFGIDKDEKAINVAIFSIYLALLDYQNPKEIENFTFPNLIKNGNFHIEDFFDQKAEFDTDFRNKKFDFILGNPPWKRGATDDNLFLKYIEFRKNKEILTDHFNKEVYISNKEIAQAFLLRTSDFSGEKTKCALIVTSKTLYNLTAVKFRKYFLYNFFIDKVFELAPVRREVFDKSNGKAIAPASILFFRYSNGKNTESNELAHLCLKPNRLFSLFKIFVLQRSDIKKVIQKRLMDYDWLWKVLVYGSYMDFNFINRLRDDYKTIDDLIGHGDEFLVKQGLKIKDGNKKNDVKELQGMAYLKTNALNQNFINPQNDTWTENQVGYIYKDNKGNYSKLFTPPILLIRGGVSNRFESVAAISYKKLVFKSSLTAIKTDNSNLPILKTISALLNSTLFSYNILQTGSSVGIERDESEDKEKWLMPYADNPKFIETIEQIENINSTIYKEKQKPLNPKVPKLESNKLKHIDKLNKEVFKSFDLNEQEYALIDYSINFTIPLIMKHKGYEQNLFSPIHFNGKLLNDYINVFLSRFKHSFKEKHLKAEIWHTNNIIGIFFKVETKKSSKNKTIEWKKHGNDDLLKKIASLGTEKITENLFIQKDIRGFEKEGFYIIKPNEIKLWHKAMAYLDVNEFMDAILKAGKEVVND